MAGHARRTEIGQPVEDARARIALLTAWRRGAGVAAVAAAGSTAIGLPGSVGPPVALGTALCVIGGAQAALCCCLRQCVLCPKLAEIPAVALYRDRLCSGRNRRGLAISLRRIAHPSPAARASPYVLWDRVALVRDELLALADELESADTVDPHTMIEIRQLLSNGLQSPLLNDRLPAAGAISVVRCARFRLITAPLQDPIRGSVPASVTSVPALSRRRRAARAPRSEDRHGGIAESRIRQRDR
jgi:hypothetical protein